MDVGSVSKRREREGDRVHGVFPNTLIDSRLGSR